MKDIIQEISKKLVAIKANNTTINAFNQLADSIINESQPLKTFIQIAQNPNPQMQGLVVETLIVTKDKLYDIVVGVDNLTVNTVWIAEILKVEILMNSTDRKIVENGVERVQKEFYCQMNLMYANSYIFFYNSNLERFVEFLDIRNTILKLK
jgi:hypothetical protein